MLVPTSDIHGIYNYMRFRIRLPACTVKHFRVHPYGDFSIYRYREAGKAIAMSLPRCQFRAQMRNNQHKIL